MIMKELKKNNERFLKNIKEKGIFRAMRIECTKTKSEMVEINEEFTSEIRSLELGSPVNFLKKLISKITFWGTVKFILITAFVLLGTIYFAFIYLIIGIILVTLLMKVVF